MRLFTKGHRVTQPQYGPGTITSMDEQYTVVEFDQHGEKRFITTMVTLETTNEPAPARSSGRRKAAGAKAAATKAAAGTKAPASRKRAAPSS